MVAGELQGFAQREREAETVHQPERERDGPAPLDIAADDIFQRHVDDRHCDQRFDQRREPQCIGREAERRGDQRYRVRNGERGDDDDERPQPPERDYQA